MDDRERDKAAFARSTALHGKLIRRVADSDGTVVLENLAGFYDLMAEDSEGYWLEGNQKQNWSTNRAIRIPAEGRDRFLATKQRDTITVSAASGGAVRIVYRGPAL